MKREFQQVRDVIERDAQLADMKRRDGDCVPASLFLVTGESYDKLPSGWADVIGTTLRGRFLFFARRERPLEGWVPLWKSNLRYNWTKRYNRALRKVGVDFQLKYHEDDHGPPDPHVALILVSWRGIANGHALVACGDHVLCDPGGVLRPHWELPKHVHLGWFEVLT